MALRTLHHLRSRRHWLIDARKFAWQLCGEWVSKGSSLLLELLKCIPRCSDEHANAKYELSRRLSLRSFNKLCFAQSKGQSVERCKGSNFATGIMGKAPSPSKKGSGHIGSRTLSSASRSDNGSAPFDDPDGGVSSIPPRVESTIVSRETATHYAFAKRWGDESHHDSLFNP